ncbi:MAG: beta strand repeat-containing protein, partial [Planctomycetota bacterium]
SGADATDNAALAAVSFDPACDYDSSSSIAVDFRDGEEDGAVPVTGTITLTVSPVNDQPTASNTTQAKAWTEGDASVALDDIVVGDADTGEQITATLTLSDPLAGSLSTGGGGNYTAGTGVWTITDTVANVNTALAAVTFDPATDRDTDASIAVDIRDGEEDGAVPVAGTITLTVTAVNDQPTATNLTQAKGWTEDDAPWVGIDDIVVSDVDTGEIITATLTLADITAGSLGTAGGGTYTAATGVWTITDTIANVNAALAAVTFIPATNRDTDTSIGIDIRDGEEDGAVPVTGTITLTVGPVNDQLTASNTTQAKAWTEGDASVALDDIVVGDVDTGEQITATLTLADPLAGSLSTAGGGNYTAGTGVWTITDSVANVNTALAAVTFDPAGDYDANTSIAVDIRDGLEDGAVPVTGTISLTVTALNDQPTASNTTQAKAWTEGDASVALDDIVVGDVDAGEQITATLTLSDPLAGSLSTAGGGNYTAGTGVWTITDTVANVNAALAAVTFDPQTDRDTDASIAVDIRDGEEDGTVPVTGTITLGVTAVNDQPTASNTTQAKAWTEGDASVALDDIVVGDVDTGEQITATLTLADPLAGSLSTAGGGNYTAGTGVWTITDSVANVNAALAAVTFDPATERDTDTSIAVDIRDGEEDGAVPVTGTITLSVTAVNDAPTVTTSGGQAAWQEGDAPIAVDPALTVADIDSASLQSATVTITTGFATGLDALTFTGQGGIGGSYDSGTGILTLTGPAVLADWQAVLRSVSFATAGDDPDTTARTIVFVVNDGALDSALASRDVTVAAVNDAPVLSLPAPQQTPENVALVLSGGVVSVSDLDADTNDLQLALSTSDGTITLATLAGLTVTAGANGTGAITVQGPVIELNAALDGLTFTPTTGFTGDATLSFALDDLGNSGNGGAQQDSGDLTITVLAGPDIEVRRGASPVQSGAIDAVGALQAGRVHDLEYDVVNTGSTDLLLNGALPRVTVTAVSGCTAWLLQLPGGTVAAAGSETFVVQVQPDSIGLAFEVSVSIDNNDVDETPYAFSITGTGVGGPMLRLARGASTIVPDAEDHVGNPRSGVSNLYDWTLHNDGDADINVTNVIISGQQNVSVVATPPGAAISGGLSDVLTLDITPAFSGWFSATVQIISNDTANPTFTFTVVGIAVAVNAPEIEVARAGRTLDAGGSDDLGTALTASASQWTYTLTNTGRATLTISGASIDTLLNATGSITTAPGGSVLPGEQTTLVVQLTPTADGAFGCVLQIDSNDTNEGTTRITLSGTAAAVVAPALTIRHAGIDLPADSTLELYDGVISGQYKVVVLTLVNQGGAALSLTAPVRLSALVNCKVSVVAQPAGPLAGPGGEATVTIRLRPVAAGAIAFRVTVESDDPTTPSYGVNVASDEYPDLQVEQPQYTALANGATHSVGSVTAGSTVVMTITLVNRGTAALTLAPDPTIGSEVNCAPSVSTPALTTLQPGQSTTVDVTLLTASAGTFSATLTVTSDDPDTATFTLILSGTATSVASPPKGGCAAGGEGSPWWLLQLLVLLVGLATVRRRRPY